jgi:CRISPR type IV-associated protein Csf1
LISPWVCWACAVCLDTRETRSAHLVVAGVFRRVDRKEVWRLLLNPPPAPFVLYLTLAGQKHGLFRQEVATSREAFRVQAEDLSGWFVRAEWEPRMESRGCATQARSPS